jgi:O-antigen ligase
VIQRFQGATPDIGGRLGIWQDTLRIIQDFPLTGTGLNTYGIAMLRYQRGEAANLRTGGGPRSLGHRSPQRPD